MEKGGGLEPQTDADADADADDASLVGGGGCQIDLVDGRTDTCRQYVTAVSVCLWGSGEKSLEEGETLEAEFRLLTDKKGGKERDRVKKVADSDGPGEQGRGNWLVLDSSHVLVSYFSGRRTELQVLTLIAFVE